MEKRTNNSIISLKLIMIGDPTGSECSCIFLYKGTKKHKNQASLSNKNLVKNHNTPARSTCHTTPNVYLTDYLWLELALVITKGIRAMPIICKHPYWWVSLDLDYYISRVNITAVMQIFTDQKKVLSRKNQSSLQQIKSTIS